MGYKNFNGISFPPIPPELGGLGPSISSYIKECMYASQFEYHEIEAFEVTDVILNDPSNRGSVKGQFINNPNQASRETIVKPKTPGKIAVPVIGEHVDVIELNGQYYYTSIINRKGSVNENSVPGISATYKKNTKYGETFEKKDVKPLEIGEGCTLWEGRFGQSLHFGNDNQKPVIKMVAGHRGTTENIDKDDSSIYLLGALGTGDIEDKKILIKSNGIFITGNNVNLNSDNIKLNSNNILIGNDADQSVVRGNDLVKFLNELLDELDLAFAAGMAAITPAGVIVTGGSAAPAPYKTAITGIKAKLQATLQQNKLLSKKVKTV